MPAPVPWSEFETAAPLIAERTRWLLQQGANIAFLATVRPSGAPHVRPTGPVLAAGGVWGFIVNLSTKHNDLLTDGRFALHCIPAGTENLEVHLEGRAERIEDAARIDAVTAAAGRHLSNIESLFEFRLDRAQSTRWHNWPTRPWPEFTRWRASEVPDA